MGRVESSRHTGYFPLRWTHTSWEAAWFDTDVTQSHDITQSQHDDSHTYHHRFSSHPLQKLDFLLWAHQYSPTLMETTLVGHFQLLGSKLLSERGPIRSAYRTPICTNSYACPCMRKKANHHAQNKALKHFRDQVFSKMLKVIFHQHFINITHTQVRD